VFHLRTHAQPVAALVVVCLAVVTLPPRSTSKQPLMVRTFLKVYMELVSYFVSARTNKDIIIIAPTVAGCRLVGCSVVSGRPLRSRAVAGVSRHVCVCLGPVLASHATSLPAAAAAAWAGRGRVHIAEWSYGGVGPVRGLRGGGRRGWCEEWAGEARTILLLHIVSVRPSKQPLMVRTFLKVYMELGSYFLFLQEQIKDIIIILQMF
jgi:hypothetical protein